MTVILGRHDDKLPKLVSAFVPRLFVPFPAVLPAVRFTQSQQIRPRIGEGRRHVPVSPIPRLLNGCGLALGLLCGVGAVYAGTGVSAADPGASSTASSGRLLDFDIPAQPLAAALDQYAGTVTQVSIGAPTDMVKGLVSSEVHGRYSPDDALHRLLAGTGLTAKRQDDGLSVSYFLSRVAAPTSPSVGWATLANQPDYAGQIQARIWQVLCADPRTEPGSYRLVFRFEVDNAGHLADPHLYDSTGDAQRDAVVLAALQRVRVSPPPPSLRHQPMMMALLPRSTPSAMRCPQKRAGDD